MIVDAGDGVRLHGVYSPQPTEPAKGSRQAKGLAIVLPGWLGHDNSTYVVSLAEHLYQQGYAVFRLNFRDHGKSLHLNPGAFRSDMLDEVYNATRQIARLEPELPLHLVGASLGGNFALRLACRYAETPYEKLGHTVAICPVLNPHHATLALDNQPIYLSYFRRKWRKALRKKAALFPELYDFSEELKCRTCLALTETFLKHYSPYPNAITYFERYTITPTMFASLATPVTMITARDDPFISAEAFSPFVDLSPNLQPSIQPYGGHVGFIDIFPYRSWISSAISTILRG